MQNWTYVGTASFGANPGVSLAGFEYDEVLTIVSLNNFDIKKGQEVLLNNPSFEFYWIPKLGESQLSQSFAYDRQRNTLLLVTVLFSSMYVRTYEVRTPSVNYNYPSRGHIDVYCR